MCQRRFCMVTTFYPPHAFGGDGVYVQQLARELAKRGHHVDVVYCVDAYRFFDRSAIEPEPELRENLKVHVLESRFGRLSPLLTHQIGGPGLKRTALKRLLDGGNFDVIHFHNASLMGAPALFRYGRAIKLYTVHEYWLVCPLSTLWTFDREPCTKRRCLRCVIHAKRPPQLWRYTGKLERAAKHIDTFISPSQAVIEKHREWGFRLPFVHLPNFSPEPDAAVDGADTSARGTPALAAGAGRPRPYFLFVGRLEPTKGVAPLIDVFEHYDAADLVIAGRGGQEAALRARAAGIAHVEFTGYLPRADLDGLYRSAVAVIVPSTWFEPFGAIVLEAFARRTPVIAHATGALPEILAQSRGGFVYETAAQLVAAMNRLVRDPAERTALGEQGRRAYERHWTPDAHLEGYFEILDRLEERGA